MTHPSAIRRYRFRGRRRDPSARLRTEPRAAAMQDFHRSRSLTEERGVEEGESRAASRNRIMAAFAKRIATKHAPCPESDTLYRPVLLYGRDSVLRTRWRESARRRKQRRNEPLVNTDHRNEPTPDHPETFPQISIPLFYPVPPRPLNDNILLIMDFDGFVGSDTEERTAWRWREFRGWDGEGRCSRWELSFCSSVCTRFSTSGRVGRAWRGRVGEGRSATALGFWFLVKTEGELAIKG